MIDRDGFPTNKLLDEIGISSDDAWELAHMNDDGEPFSEIADYIERNL
jgi:hypothetical protein